MARFFFHVRCRQHFMPDRAGLDLPAHSDLLEHARAFARDPARQAQVSLLSDRDCCIEIVDELREPVALVRVRDLLASG